MQEHARRVFLLRLLVHLPKGLGDPPPVRHDAHLGAPGDAHAAQLVAEEG